MKDEQRVRAASMQGAAVERETTDVIGMDDETTAFAVLLFAALAHPTRLKIVEMLTEQERTVNEVAEVLSLLQPNASQHLAVLSRAGIVKSTREGAMRCYALRGPRIAQIMHLVNEFRVAHAPNLGRAMNEEKD